MDLDATGHVIYTAHQFNLSSHDNCSDTDEMTYFLSTDSGTVWNDSIYFDCSAIGTPVKIWFLVIDEATNDSIEKGDIRMEVRDVTDPYFIKNSEVKNPYCATHDAVFPGLVAYTDSTISESVIQLLAGDYADNCGVTKIRYMLEHSTYNPPGYNDWHEVPSTEFPPKVFTFNFNPATFLTFYEGITTVTFEIWDGSDSMDDADRNKTIKPIYTISVLPKPNPGSGIE